MARPLKLFKVLTRFVVAAIAALACLLAVAAATPSGSGPRTAAPEERLFVPFFPPLAGGIVLLHCRFLAAKRNSPAAEMHCGQILFTNYR